MKEPYVPMKLNLLSMSATPGFCGDASEFEGIPGVFTEQMNCPIPYNAVGGASVNIQNS